MAVGQTYELLDIQAVVNASNPVINRYYYQHISGEGLGAQHLAMAYVEQVLPTILDIQTAGVEHVEIQVRTPDDLGDFWSLPLTTDNVGTFAGEMLPGFVVWKFHLHRQFLSFRTGSKAFSGVGEAAQSSGLPVSGMDTLLDATASILTEVIAQSGDPNEFAPVLVKNYSSAPPIREVAQIINASFKRIGTQNTRK